jgi:hypothetical protein
VESSLRSHMQITSVTPAASCTTSSVPTVMAHSHQCAVCSLFEVMQDTGVKHTAHLYSNSQLDLGSNVRGLSSWRWLSTNTFQTYFRSFTCRVPIQTRYPQKQSDRDRLC